MIQANGSMKKRRLGRTELEVTPIGLGAMQFSGGRGMLGMMMSHLSQEEVSAITKAALDGGINWFDTAEMYGRGHSERGLANALHASGKMDSEVIVATKWSPILRTAKNIPSTIDDRTRFLGGYTIDLYMVHQPWGFSSPEAEMDAMADLVEMGKIRSVGVSNFDAERMRRAHAALQKRGLPLAVNQVQYNLLHRRIETNGVLEAARELGITIVAWSPLASGLLTAKFHAEPDRLSKRPYGRRMLLRRRIERARPLVNALEKVATKYDATPAQVALNWLVTFQGETVVAIPGASKVHHAEQNARALNFRLSDEELGQLDDLSRTNHA